MHKPSWWLSRSYAHRPVGGNPWGSGYMRAFHVARLHCPTAACNAGFQPSAAPLAVPIQPQALPVLVPSVPQMSLCRRHSLCVDQLVAALTVLVAALASSVASLRALAIRLARLEGVVPYLRVPSRV